MSRTADMTQEQRKRQYELEQQARREILASSPAERSEVTQKAYDRLYSNAPWHSSLRATPESRAARVKRQATLLTQHVARAKRVLEVGCGRGDLLTYLAQRFPGVEFTGIDISEVKIDHVERAKTPNLTFLAGDCVEPPAPQHTYDLIISSQVLEHFHPDDTPKHLHAVCQLLAPGGTYEMDTPHRYTGPHDVSKFFTREASGTHLKEWTFAELSQALRAAGFTRIETDVPFVAHLRRILPVPGDAVLMPVGVKVALEQVLRYIPGWRLRRAVFRMARMDNMLLYASTAKTHA
ncbi:MAG TPA: class I SAM-dependent methyltransferase [Ktedonobacterales bacterium]|nr:class I SAM-dependent methyltransferase [Ktedonobacterales bacterium]